MEEPSRTLVPDATAGKGTASPPGSPEDWRQDTNGVWWQKDAKGGDGEDGPYDNEFKRLPHTVAEILPLARELAVRCGTAALNTIAELTPGGALFPRSRTVSPRHYINENFTEVSVATKIFTRKVQELTARPEASMLWKDDDGKTGGWVLAMGRAEIVPDKNAGKSVDVDGHDKAKVLFRVERLEIQDYRSNILGFGADRWHPCVLELQEGEWVRIN